MASKDGNGLVISLSIFVLLTIGLGVAWYMTWTHSADVQRELTASQKAESGSKATIQDQIGQLSVLKQIIGHGNPDLPTDEVVTGVRTGIAAFAGDGSASASAQSLEPAMIKNATDRDINMSAASERQILAQTKTDELNAANSKHDSTMKSMQAQVAEKEGELRKKELLHGEQLIAREKQIDDLKINVREEQDKFTTLQTQSSRQIEELENDIREKREALIVLTQKAREQEDLSFEREDGRLVFVDQSSLTGSIDLGSRDELRVGTTFSVYKKNNSGVGRRSNEDIKGKIEVIKITGDHNAVVRIVDQLAGNPLAKEDPIYSPIFASGQKLEVAVAGLLDFDGNPGGDRDEFIRLVSGANAKIVIQIGDDAKLVDQNQTELTEADPIRALITEKTRFLIIGDLGETNQTQDSVKQALYQKMQQNASKMKEAALNNGVHVISLSSFLEYVGYSRKNIAFKTGDKFPGFLTNGGLSPNVSNAPRQVSSLGAVSGIYAKPGRKPYEANGAVSSLYANPSDDE
ncbi:MAG: hypothetical protein NTX48_08670 [Planctomycetales bacterium]|nr:hypothetical protein [Planctomycetales bacterium]